MKRIMRNWSVALLLVASIGGAVATVAVPQTTFAACNDRLLTFPAWHRGLTDANCDIIKPASSKAGLTTFVWAVVLNVIEMMLQLVGYLAVGFIIFGGFKYMYSAGSADGMVQARKIIMNAVIGLVLSIFSIAIINVVAGALK